MVTGLAAGGIAVPFDGTAGGGYMFSVCSGGGGAHGVIESHGQRDPRAMEQMAPLSSDPVKSWLHVRTGNETVLKPN